MRDFTVFALLPVIVALIFRFATHSSGGRSGSSHCPRCRHRSRSRSRYRRKHLLRSETRKRRLKDRRSRFSSSSISQRELFLSPQINIFSIFQVHATKKSDTQRISARTAHRKSHLRPKRLELIRQTSTTMTSLFQVGKH